jgi:hypothetical protein
MAGNDDLIVAILRNDCYGFLGVHDAHDFFPPKMNGRYICVVFSVLKLRGRFMFLSFEFRPIPGIACFPCSGLQYSSVSGTAQRLQQKTAACQWLEASSSGYFCHNG